MATVLQRPQKGSRISTFYPVKDLPPLSTLDSAFQLQEYISLIIRLDIHDVEAIVSIPESHGPNGEDNGNLQNEELEGERDGRGEYAVDEACWIYEQLRRLAQDLSHPLITMLQQECTRKTCPEMKAGEWLYLCVAHGNDGAMEQCCAIDYILHTVDSATALLNSPRAFPSRISIPTTSHRHFSSLARRLGRIFAHAYFHHREVFEQAEAESSLYGRFLALTSKFDLVPQEFLIIPRISPEDHGSDVEPPRLLAAAVDPQAAHQPEDESRGRVPAHRFDQSGLGLGQSPSAVDRNPSPRKGRSRTDTMVFSEGYIIAEELSKSMEAESEPEPQPQYDRDGSEEATTGSESESVPPPDHPPETAAEPEELPSIVEPLQAVPNPLPELSSPVDPILAGEPEDDVVVVETPAPEPSEPSEIPEDLEEPFPEELPQDVDAHPEEESRDVTDSIDASEEDHAVEKPSSPPPPSLPADVPEADADAGVVIDEEGGAPEVTSATSPEDLPLAGDDSLEDTQEEEDVTEAVVEHDEEAAAEGVKEAEPSPQPEFVAETPETS
ncbi:Mob1/phocein [Artomyces pyxidatus]|uniref:Mob1/phocein n=1 Tax=Artomyces pyxidatus TaxID=48021 RepID=A0ACB8T913_9AGAM|nr:Mob1/phocein [Artomyces pyxidatus]